MPGDRRVGRRRAPIGIAPAEPSCQDPSRNRAGGGVQRRRVFERRTSDPPGPMSLRRRPPEFLGEPVVEVWAGHCRCRRFRRNRPSAAPAAPPSAPGHRHRPPDAPYSRVCRSGRRDIARHFRPPSPRPRAPRNARLGVGGSARAETLRDRRRRPPSRGPVLRSSARSPARDPHTAVH